MCIFHKFFLTDITVLAKFVIKTPPQIFLTLRRTSVNGAEISYIFSLGISTHMIHNKNG